MYTVTKYECEIDQYYNKSGYIGDLSQNYKGTNMEWYEFVEKEIKKITFTLGNAKIPKTKAVIPIIASNKTGTKNV